MAAGPVAAVWPPLDALNHAAPLWFIGSVLCLGLIALIWRRRLKRARTALVCAGFSVLAFGAAVVPEALAGLRGPSPVHDARARLRVVSLNLWVDSADPRPAVEYLVGSGADIVVLAEAGDLYAPAFAPLRAAYPFVVPSISSPYAFVAILSRHPPTAINTMTAQAYDVVPAGGRARQLRWADATFVIDGVPVHVVAVHAHRSSADYTGAELAAMAQFLARQPDRAALIVAGDFNMTPWTHILRRFGAEAGLSRATRNIPTYPTAARGNPHWPPAAFLPIDHQFSGRGWHAETARRGPNVGSDHFPIVVTYAAPNDAVAR